MTQFVVECQVVVEADTYDAAMDKVEDAFEDLFTQFEVEAAWAVESGFSWKD